MLAGKGEKDIAAIIAENLTERKDLIDTVHNCLIAAGGSEDIDELEKEVNLAGKKPSDFIRKQFQELQKDNKNLLKIIWVVITNINNNRKIERRVPLWSAVADFCGLGSTSAGKLCERLGFRDDITVGKENPPK
jgi:hypothetical protein